MPDFFVWTMPSFVTVFQAKNEQEAAEVFLDKPVKTEPEVGLPPNCYVQPTRGRASPQMDGTAEQFWAVLDDEEQGGSVV